MIRILRLVGFVVALTIVGSSCGADQASMIGLVRDQPLDVSSIALPDETPGATEPMFIMKAQPNELLMVYFGYTMCPDLCPTTLADFRSALSRIDGAADRIDLAFITVDPERDTADRLAPYLASFVDQITYFARLIFHNYKRLKMRFSPHHRSPPTIQASSKFHTPQLRTSSTKTD